MMLDDVSSRVGFLKHVAVAETPEFAQAVMTAVQVAPRELEGVLAELVEAVHASQDDEFVGDEFASENVEIVFEEEEEEEEEFVAPVVEAPPAYIYADPIEMEAVSYKF